MVSLKITIPGRPFGKERHRTTRHGHVYTPTKTRDLQRYYAVLFKIEWGSRPPLRGPVELTVRCYFGRTQTDRKRDRWYQRKPDTSNVVKLVEDALEIARVVHNDSQFCLYGSGTGKYLTDGEPRTEIEVKELEARKRT